MSAFGRFFLPGPTEVHPDVLQAMTRPMIGHRGSHLSGILAEIDPVLRTVFGTTRPVYVATASATGLMEASVRNGVRSRALALVNGAFSARFRDLVTESGRECETYEVPWGHAHEPDEVERRLRGGGFDAVTVVHSETSTGVLNPVPEIAQAVQATEKASGDEILLMVDGVTSVGGDRVAPEAWGVDFLLTGSQKALALPPGLAFGTPSERLLRRAETIPGRGQYFDLLEMDRYWAKHQTPQTPAVSLIFALEEQMRRIEAEGMAARAARHCAMAERCWAWTEAAGARWGMSILAPEGRRSPTVTTIRVAPEHSGPTVCARLADRGYTIGTGYGKLKDETIRIGHMGDHTSEELDLLLANLEEVLA